MDSHTSSSPASINERVVYVMPEAAGHQERWRRANRGGEGIVFRAAGVVSGSSYLLAAYFTFKQMQMQAGRTQRSDLLKAWCCLGVMRYAATILPRLRVLEAFLAVRLAIHASADASDTAHDEAQAAPEKRVNRLETRSLSGENLGSALFDFIFDNVAARCCKCIEAITTRTRSCVLDAVRILLVNGIASALSALSQQQLQEYALTLQTSLLLLERERAARQSASRESFMLDDDLEQSDEYLTEAYPPWEGAAPGEKKVCYLRDMTDYGDEDVLGAENDKDDDDDDDDDDHNEEEGMIADNLPAFDLYKRQQWSMNGTLEMDCHEGKVPEYQERFDLHNKVFREEKDCEVDKLGFLDDEENADVLNRQPPLCGLLRVSESTSAHYDEVFTNSIRCKEFLREDHSEEECKDDFPGDTMESMIDYGTSEML